MDLALISTHALTPSWSGVGKKGGYIVCRVSPTEEYNEKQERTL